MEQRVAPNWSNEVGIVVQEKREPLHSSPLISVNWRNHIAAFYSSKNASFIDRLPDISRAILDNR